MLGNVDIRSFALQLSCFYQLSLSRTDMDHRMNECLKYEQSSETELEYMSCMFDLMVDIR